MTINLLNDRYQVIRTLGAGGFGETYLAEDTYMPSKRLCVVKQLRPIQNNPQIYQLVQERFQREAAILEELGGSTDQIPTLYAYFCADEQFYLVQEWIEGDTLTKKVQQQGLLSADVVQELLVNLLPILEYVHSKQIIHRDIKPDNIILRYGDGKPVLIDFGAVRESMGTVVNSQGNTTSSIVIGTPGYMPSEQAAGRAVYSSDLYSLGLTAIYLLTGMQPQQLDIDSQTGEIIWRNYVNNISPFIASVIDQAIAYHPRDRYPTARAMLDALQSTIYSIPPTQAVVPPTQAIQKPQLQPVVTTPTPTKVPVNTQLQTSGSKNAMIIGGLIAAGLIGGSVIISQVLTKSPQPIANQKTASSIATSNINSPMVETPAVTTPPVVTTTSSVSKVAQPQPLPPRPLDHRENRPPRIRKPLYPPPDLPTSTNNYFWLSERAVTDADLQGKTGFELDIMRNTIFALHGRRFENPGIQDYFNNQPWYQPQYSAKDFPIKLLSNLEMRNAAYIARYQDIYKLRHFKK
ncbi:serine/threonine protein kinase [Nostoc sp. PCC 7524]|uniref:protein kinase domain-containing protein n=1 Tax=Nostoc sp. (strain ATCC 29411 / PCC 7524) TaxID=28072 RepID=UPI00029F0A74|nr:YARHG domain-containing protein [Nostoc sp. PCC 7524]AFY50322.1 serine/threonine protein kinase [Nostoc sp. PCC 7524]